MGRPPLPPDERGKRVNVYLSAAALAAVEALTTEETMSALISRLLVEALKKRRRREG